MNKETGAGSAPPKSISTLKPLTEAASRALAEAQLRRAAALALETAAEINGRGGLEPVRFGDWEVRGLATDF